MEISTIEIRKLTASEGMILTNGEIYSSVGGDIYLGKNDSADNWHEITEEEYNTMMSENEIIDEYENETPEIEVIDEYDVVTEKRKQDNPILESW